MAVILRSGTQRSGTQINKVPIRSSTIHIAQTGLVSNITGDGGQNIKVINLGYQGDHNVTRIFVHLWKNASVFSAKYEAVLVFYQEANKISNTLSMSNNEADFYVDLPDDITKTSGNYQIHFVLKEKLDGAYEGGAIGAEDDPAYREVFISASCKGAVDPASGFSLVPLNFDWETDLYDYRTGVICSSEWTEPTEEGVYSTSIYLGGLVENTPEDKIVITPPEGVTWSNKALNGNTLTFDATIDDDRHTYQILEEIQISYPVVFSVTDFSNLAQKTPIKITHTATSIGIESDTNANLGMKMDAYITPIEVSSLLDLPANVKRYVVFSKNQRSLVCEAEDGINCWIPTAVTGESGTWEVSFIVKGTSIDEATNYTYYTGILRLPVVDNILTRSDLATDTSYRAILDIDGKSLYDSNEYALYAITDSSTEAKLSYTATTINNAIGWIDTIAELHTAQDVINAIGKFNQVYNNQTTMSGRLDTLESVDEDLRSQINLLNSTDTNIIADIAALRGEIAELDVTELSGVVETQGTKISALESRATILEGQAEALSSRATEIDAKVNKNTRDIATHTSEIATIKNNAAELAEKVSSNTGRIDIAEGDIVNLEVLVDRINARVPTYENYSKLIKEEIETRAIKDQELENAITAEVERASSAEEALTEGLTTTSSTLDALIQTVSDNKTSIEASLAAEVETRTNADIAFNTRTSALETSSRNHSTELENLTTRMIAVETDKSIIRNDYVVGDPKTIVAKIVFLKSQNITALATLVDSDVEELKEELMTAGIVSSEVNWEEDLSGEQVYETIKLKEQVENGTLYLIQDEE